MDGKKILLVDDDVDFLKLLKKRIESWGYQVFTASCGDDAISMFTSERPSALILDYNMPDINGIDLLKKIRELDKRVPVVMFTAQPTMKAMETGTQLNVLAFIPKVSSLIDTEKDLQIALELIFK